MSRIVFSSAAFWGDVMPYVPIANELAARGHRVVYSLPARHHALLGDESFELHDNGSTFTHHDVLGDPAQLRMLEKQQGSTTGTALVRYWAKRYIADEADIWADRTAEVLDGADLLVTHPTAATLAAIPAQAMQLPWVCGQLFPSMIPSAHSDPAGMSLSRLPGPLARGLRRSMWRLAPVMASRIMRDREVNAVRARYGIAPKRGNLMTAWMDATRTVVLSSPHYSPPQPDWPDGIEVTGFTVWPGPASTELDPSIDAYLADGPPPVLVTMGTSTATIAGPILRDVAAALAQLGRRGLYLVGNDDNVCALEGIPGVFEFAPLGQVIDRCTAVVHQGGHGTTAVTLQAALPAVAIPMGFDQIAHGRRLEALGVGRLVRVTSRTRVADIVRALHDLDDADLRGSAAELGRQIAEEHGVARAADAVEASL